MTESFSVLLSLLTLTRYERNVGWEWKELSWQREHLCQVHGSRRSVACCRSRKKTQEAEVAVTKGWAGSVCLGFECQTEDFKFI